MKNRHLPAALRFTVFYTHLSAQTCWVWTGAILPNGYGRFWNGAKNVYAHRFSYELFRGMITEGYEIDHLCKNRACVNPHHLEAVIHKENIRRGDGVMGVNARKQFCFRGHEFRGDNLRITIRGERACRACVRINVKKYKAKKKEALKDVV